jgi:hypothetical protein
MNEKEQHIKKLRGKYKGQFSTVDAFIENKRSEDESEPINSKEKKAMNENEKKLIEVLKMAGKMGIDTKRLWAQLQEPLGVPLFHLTRWELDVVYSASACGWIEVRVQNKWQSGRHVDVRHDDGRVARLIADAKMPSLDEPKPDRNENYPSYIVLRPDADRRVTLEWHDTDGSQGIIGTLDDPGLLCADFGQDLRPVGWVYVNGMGEEFIHPNHRLVGFFINASLSEIVEEKLSVQRPTGFLLEKLW